MSKTEMPSIRFYGFDNDWEQRKLSEITDKATEKNAGLQYVETFTNSAEFGIISQRDFFDHDIAKLGSLYGYYIVKNEDFVYNPRISTSAPVGPINRNKLGRTGVMSPLYTVFRPHDIDTTYLEYFFKCGYWHSFMNFNGDSGARSDRFSIRDNVFFQMPIPIPDIDEQRKIGELLTCLDNLITLHQRKFEKLTNVKKSMLEKMFPRNGSCYPEIRFKGFTDPWEQRKLGDNIIEYTEVTTKNNQYPPLTSSRKGIFLQTEYFAGNQIASDNNTGYNIVPYGYFTYRHMSDDEIFHFNINDIVENGIVSTLYPVFTTDESLDSRYLQYQLNYGSEFAKFAILQKQGGSRTYIYLNKLKQLNLTMPKSVEEQKTISAFFMNLDHLITLHQRELKKLQSIKKALLEKMFV